MEDFTFANSLSKEVRLGYQKIAKETKDILSKGYYRVNGRKVDLRLSTGVYEYEAVEVYSPDRLCEILKDDDEYMKKQFYPPEDHEIIVCQMEGFEVAKEYFNPLILNCSNAFYPGGGFMVGLDDAEERLCRASSLYLSLSSQKASQMYLYHEYYKSKLNSDFMLLSPKVAVFRNSYMELVDHPYPVSVLSVACVDHKNVKEQTVKVSEIETVMKERIRKLLMLAARNMYRNLIIGAFGINYGHSSYHVARYFYDILIDEEYIEMFEHVIFSISYDTEKEILKNFTSVFESVARVKFHTQPKDCFIASIQTQSYENEFKIEERVHRTESKQAIRNYIQAFYPFPECNYQPSMHYNIQLIGLAQGILKDGVPLVGELYKKKMQEETVAVFVLPYIEKLHQKKVQVSVVENKAANNKSFFYSVLCNGMEICSETIGDITLEAYLQYLNYMGIINLQKSNVEALAQVLYDKAGHKVVAIEITVKDTQQIENTISIQFQPFTQVFLEDKKGT